jgi:hypothetical protein
MYSKSAWRISSHVIIGSYWTASTFIEWKKLSTQALSQQFPFLLIFFLDYGLQLSLGSLLNNTGYLHRYG